MCMHAGGTHTLHSYPPSKHTKPNGAFTAFAFELWEPSDFINLPQIPRTSLRKTREGKTMLIGLRRVITLQSQRWGMGI